MIDENKVVTCLGNIPWLTDMPSHWKMVRSKTLFSVRKERAFPDDEQLSATQAFGVIPQAEYEKRIGRKVVRITQHLEKRAHVEKDDFVISMRSFQGGLERAWARGCIRSSYVILQPSPEVHVDYFAHLFKSHDYIRALQATSNFIRDGQDLSLRNFSLVDLPLPPLGEQILIGRFLDHADRKIRRYIRAKRKLIALLNEQKQAIIHQAVTRGLDPRVKLKPSGIDWLGDVPEHWRTVPLRLRYDQCLGKMVDAKKFTGEYAIPYLRNTDVQWGTINVEGLPVIDIALHERERFTVKSGDLLVCEGGEVGRCAFWNGELEPCGFQKALHRLRPLDSQQDFAPFLYYCMWIASKIGVFAADGNENTIAHLTGVKLRGHRFSFPPVAEQRAIADHLDTVSLELGKAVTSAEREIQLIGEYRTRLIADVVTGKLDVREATAQLDGKVAEKPSKRRSATQPNKHFYRSVLAAEIVDRHQGERRFGRIKLQKALVLAEYHLQLTEIQSDLKRAAAGPFDNKMMRSIESQLKEQEWFESVKASSEGSQISYLPLQKQGGHRYYFERYWSNKQTDFDRLISLLKPMRTIQAEIVATLYSAWNDFLIDGEQFDDDRLVAEVLTNWHPKKERIAEDRWHKAIRWMRENQLVPTGFGAHTKQQSSKTRKK